MEEMNNQRRPKKEYWEKAHRIVEPEVTTTVCPSDEENMTNYVNCIICGERVEGEICSNCNFQRDDCLECYDGRDYSNCNGCFVDIYKNAWENHKQDFVKLYNTKPYNYDKEIIERNYNELVGLVRAVRICKERFGDAFEMRVLWKGFNRKDYDKEFENTADQDDEDYVIIEKFQEYNYKKGAWEDIVE